MKSGVRSTHSIAFAIVLLVFLMFCLSACQESMSSKYEKANKLLAEGKYTEAAAIFDEIATYEDASKMSLYTKAINAAETGDYETAFSTFTSLGEFKDCPMMIAYYKGRQNEASVYDGAWIYGSKWFDAIELYESIPLFRDSKDRAESCRKAAYDQAIKSGDEGDTSFAVSILKELGTYSHAAKQVTYYQAIALLKQGDYSGASNTFSTIPGFRDADSRVTSALEDGYNAAAAKEEAGVLDEANAIFLNLGEYKDSADRAYKLYYDAGTTRREAGDWDGARSAFTKAGEYKDATEQIKETTYQEASALESSGDQEGAYKLFTRLGEYKDSFERANKPYYELGALKRDNQEWDAARAAFKHAGLYSDAADQIKETTYQEASALEEAGDQEGAYKVFTGLGEYKDSFERANKPYYELGVVKRDNQEWDAARAAFEHAGTYGDAEEQILATYYAEGIAKQKVEDWEGAETAFINANGYTDSLVQICETKYLQARALMETGDYDGAMTILINLRDYKDVDILLREDVNLVAAIRKVKTAAYREVGNVVTFGTYPQTSSGTDQTQIEWIVLDFDEVNHKALLLSKYGLDAVPYNKEFTHITWEQCTLRTWLNGEFLNKAFSAKEQSAIVVTNVDNSSGQGYSGFSMGGENNTQDRIFLLSYAEANRYLGVTFEDYNNTKSRVAPTAYAIAQGAKTKYSNLTADGKPTRAWFLRSPGNDQRYVAVVDVNGPLRCTTVTSDNIVVRPAFWLNLESDIF